MQSSKHSDDKWKQIQRNLAEQQSFVRSIMHKNSPNLHGTQFKNQNGGDVENILSTSIQKAKEKISSLQARTTQGKLSTSRERLSHSRQKTMPNNSSSSISNLPTASSSDNTAIAKALKKLQQRITVLEQQKSSIQFENTRLQSQNTKQKQQQQNTEASLQQARRKSKNLQQSLVKDKKYIKQLETKLKNLEKQYEHRHLETIQEQQEEQIKEKQLNEKLSTTDMLYRAQNEELKSYIVELEEKERIIRNLENIKKEEYIRHQELESQFVIKRRQLEEKIAILQDKETKRQGLINQLKQQIRTVQSMKQINSSVNLSNNSIIIPSNSNNISSSNFNTNSKHHQQTHAQLLSIQQQLSEHKQKYEQLYTAYKILDEKYRKQKLQSKNFRNKFWELKQLTKQTIEKINGLPNALTSQLRYLIVKINKIEAFGNQYYAATPKKISNTDRSSSKSRSKSHTKSNSKSISKTKGSNLYVNISSTEDLNCSKNSSRSALSNRSKSSKDLQKNTSNKSIKSKKSNHSKQKQVIISQKSIKNPEVRQLEQQIQEIKKKYKEIGLIFNRNQQEQTEDMRNQLYYYANMLRVKSEQLTRIKKKKQ